MSLALLILQIAAAQAAAPDIELQVRVKAREVQIERRGKASLEVHADPPLIEDVKVDATRLPPGSNTLRDVDITIDAQARIADRLRDDGAGDRPINPEQAGE